MRNQPEIMEQQEIDGEIVTFTHNFNREGRVRWKVERFGEEAKEEYVGHAEEVGRVHCLLPRCWRGRECKVSLVSTCVCVEDHGGHSHGRKRGNHVLQGARGGGRNSNLLIHDFIVVSDNWFNTGFMFSYQLWLNDEIINTYMKLLNSQESCISVSVYTTYFQ